MNTKDTLFAIYLKVISNEAIGDKRWAGYININEYTIHEVVRPAHLVKLIKKYPKIFHLLYGIATRGWWTLNFVISLGLFLKFLVRKIYLTSFDHKTVTSQESSICIVATHKVLLELKLLEKDAIPQTLVSIPNIPVQDDLGENHIQISSLITTVISNMLSYLLYLILMKRSAHRIESELELTIVDL